MNDFPHVRELIDRLVAADAPHNHVSIGMLKPEADKLREELLTLLALEVLTRT